MSRDPYRNTLSSLRRKTARYGSTAAVWFLISAATAVQAAPAEPLLINRIVIDSQNPDVLYAAARPHGVLKSTDRGETWRSFRSGLFNTSVTQLIVHPAKPSVLYLGTFGGGVYRSVDAGGAWTEINRGLGNTNIHALALRPGRPDRLAVSTSTGDLYFSADGGGHWIPFGDGLPEASGEVWASLRAPTEDFPFYLLARNGLFLRSESASAWTPVAQSLGEGPFTALVLDARAGILYAGTMRRGLWSVPVGLGKRGLGGPLSWIPAGGALSGGWIRWVTGDSVRPGVLYAGAAGRGLFRSGDGGKSWKDITQGLPEREITALAVDPKEPGRLYAGGSAEGIFISGDEGNTWRAPRDFDPEPLSRIEEEMSASGPFPGTGEEPPAAFARCNRCHGWSDPRLNLKNTFWRVAANQRDWGPTVRRMARGADLTAEEEGEVIRFLDRITRSGKP